LITSGGLKFLGSAIGWLFLQTASKVIIRYRTTEGGAPTLKKPSILVEEAAPVFKTRSGFEI
jgi:hypothetical protein